ncbi:MAG: serine/threonine-protein kinase [Acidimicrobiales bacterium]
MQDLPTISEADLRLSRLLGSGRHGAVFLATHTGPLVASPLPTAPGVTPTRVEPAFDVAVKMPAPHVDTAGEFEALIRFDHPNIVQVRAARLCNGALVLEACDGGTLADLLESGPLEIGQVRPILAAIGSALEHIHGLGWIHGDVSPANIAFRSNGSAVLLDFATARPADASPLEEGTIEFAGPIRIASPEVDLRSLAATGLCSLGVTDEPATNRLRASLQAMVDSADAGRVVQTRDLRVDEPIPIVAITDPFQRSGEEQQRVDGDGRSRPEASSGTNAPGSPPQSGRESRPEASIDTSQPNDADRESRPEASSEEQWRPTPTTPFGPRPKIPAPTTDEKRHPHRSRLPVILALTAVFALLIGNDWWISELRSGSPVDRADEVEVDVPALESLSNAGVRWEIETGTLHSIDADPPERWRVGEPGDLAAVGDWSCDGLRTLGVYRPSTGSWFTFVEWSAGASSSVPEQLDVDATVLSVRRVGGSCDQPAVLRP